MRDPESSPSESGDASMGGDPKGRRPYRFQRLLGIVCPATGGISCPVYRQPVDWNTHQSLPPARWSSNRIRIARFSLSVVRRHAVRRAGSPKSPHSNDLRVRTCDADTKNAVKSSIRGNP